MEKQVIESGICTDQVLKEKVIKLLKQGVSEAKEEHLNVDIDYSFQTYYHPKSSDVFDGSDYKISIDARLMVIYFNKIGFSLNPAEQFELLELLFNKKSELAEQNLNKRIKEDFELLKKL